MIENNDIQKTRGLSNQQDIRNAYLELQNLLKDSLNSIEELHGVNKQFDITKNIVAQKLKEKILNAKKELNSTLKNTTWDNLVIVFFGETNAGKSTIIETFRILFDNKREKEDGLIVGDGSHDFTKTYSEYKLSIDGVPFTLIDVPGIEGNEDDFKDGIKIALMKAHCVFYVQGHNKKPDAKTALKIKQYLGDRVKVYSIYNVRGSVTNYDEAEDRETLITHSVGKIEELIKAEFKNILGEVYIGHITLQGLLAMSSKACFSSKREDLIRGQQELLKYFGNSPENILQFSQFQTLVDLVENKAANFKSVIIEANKQKLISLAENINTDINECEQQTNNELDRLSNGLRSIKHEICNNRMSCASRNITNKANTVIDNAYSQLKSEIFRLIDSKPDNIKYLADEQQRKILEDLQTKISMLVQQELTSINDTANRKIKALDGISIATLHLDGNIAITGEMDFSGAFENLEVDFADCCSWITKVAGTTATGALGGPWGAAIGFFVGVIAATLTSDDGKADAKKSVSDAIKKVKETNKNKTSYALRPICDDINKERLKLSKAVNTELDNIAQLKESLEEVSDNISGYIQNLKHKQYGKI